MTISLDTQTVQLGSQSIKVCIKKGKPNTIPLLIANGIGASLDLLTPFVEAMHQSNPDLEIITFDSVGVGGSSTPCLPYRFSGLARTVTQMLDYLGYQKINLLGYSWGGFLSQQFVHDYPERVDKLILCATATGVTSVPPSLRVLNLMASPRRYTDPEFMASVAPEIYGGKFRSDTELAVKYAQKMGSKKSNGLGYTYQQAAICWWTSLHMLPSIKQPTLLLCGDDDPLIKLCNMELMNVLIPNSELRVFDGEGHMFLLTSLDEVVPIVNEFLEG